MENDFHKDWSVDTFIHVINCLNIILFNDRNFVPISLIVSLEMVKFLQGKIIQKDKNCCSSSGIWANV